MGPMGNVDTGGNGVQCLFFRKHSDIFVYPDV